MAYMSHILAALVLYACVCAPAATADCLSRSVVSAPAFAHMPTPMRRRIGIHRVCMGGGDAAYAPRRAAMKLMVGAAASAAWSKSSSAFELVPPAPKEGDCADCIGVTNGFLANCPDSPICVSSQDDQGETVDWANAYAEPWIYEGTPVQALANIKFQVKRLGGTIVKETKDYLRCQFRSQTVPGQVDAVDDTEMYLTPNDATVQFRSSRRKSKLTASPLGDFGANKKRMETIRIALHWEKVPVLRNRKRVFFFFESPLDTFGPACNGIGCGEDLQSSDDLKRPQRFDNDPLAAPALPRPQQPKPDEQDEE